MAADNEAIGLARVHQYFTRLNYKKNIRINIFITLYLNVHVVGSRPLVLHISRYLNPGMSFVTLHCIFQPHLCPSCDMASMPVYGILCEV